MKGDTFKHRGMRRKLVAAIREMEVTDEAVLSAIEKVPRHLFLDPAFEKQAYENTAFQIGAGQTISQPYTVAFQTALLELKKGEKVLEIGTGSGFQTAVLLELGVKVFSIERQRELYNKTKPLLTEMGYSAKLFYGDGYKGKEIFAPYDKILITCGAPFVPDALLEQLKPGGIMVIPVGEGRLQEMKRITKNGDGTIEEVNFGTFSFVPMVEEKH
ncbi:MAG: protein-L-isoaspartate O-methyltransferase [Crocinitomicaceae bacterium]|nr:protein-L-isoaspartate O-methyltransferase [Crocinitomicaceae bacterium]|tara:strand:- start:507 stop:1151 length:645 start_codon:yes stop_codon:yes gene_type:complete